MQGKQSYLERIRTQKGEDACREMFEQTCKQNRMRGSALLNDDGITFPTLYTLFSSIHPRLQYLRLNQRNRQMLQIISAAKSDETGNGKIELLSKKQPLTRNILLWALKSGYRFDGDNSYDYIMDIASCVLLETYHLKEALPYVEALIFQRNQQAKNIHDLVWAYFHLRDPQVLKRMSEHLQANDPSEVELARELLDVEHVCAGCQEPHSQYEAYQKWLTENNSYLVFTEESLLYSRKPKIWNIDQDSKFLQRKLTSRKKQPLENLNAGEEKWLQEFNSLNPNERETVSCFSHRIHQDNEKTWSDWMGSSLDEKLEKAKTGMEILV